MINFIKNLRAEININSEIKIKLLILLFRLGSVLERQGGLLRVAYYPFNFIYFLYSQIALSLELPLGTRIGWGLRIYHGFSVVINKKAIIGRDVIIRHGVTIGNTSKSSVAQRCSPVIGDSVEFGCMSIVIGPVTIGHHARIGAGCAVNKDVLPNVTVVNSAVREYTQ